MLNNVNTNVERIIAKIDNDFNPDNSDWIPRVGAWCIDAMSQLNVTPTKRKRKKVTVNDRIAYSDCPINNNNIKVFDSNGCEIKKAKEVANCNSCPSTGGRTSATSASNTEFTPDTINIINNNNANKAPDYLLAETLNDKNWPGRYRVNEFSYGNREYCKERNYVIVDCDKIELNFDDDFIYIESEYIETVCSDIFNCELPVIPNNGLLIEALVYYCMYKMLCRGYVHKVFNLNASQYGTNPYYIWNNIKEEARRSVINGKVDTDTDISKLLRSNFYINTFDPRA